MYIDRNILLNASEEQLIPTPPATPLYSVLLFALYIALAVVLSGCAAPAVYRDGYGFAAHPQTLAECELEGIKASALIRGGLEAGYVRGETRHLCMQSKGYLNR